MELDFIAELDATISNVGTEKVWKRKVGSLEIWLSPISVVGQEKVSYSINKAEPGSNVIGESKRVILSNSIVGINKTDLTEYRISGAPIFPSKNRDGKTVKVPLEKYLYDKIAQWGHQYLDDVFAVYADLMETHQQENLKEITFENAKDPHLELKELEERVSNLRSQLGMPQLVEATDADQDLTPEQIAEALKDEGKTEKEISEDFDPFRSIPTRPQSVPVTSQTSEVITPTVARPTPPSPPPQPIMSMPAVLPANLRRPMPDGQSAKESSPDNPHVATPSVMNEVIEKQSEKVLTRPKIDQNQGSVNPRFKQPGR